MNTKTIFTIVGLLAAVAVTGTVMGTQYVSACPHGHHGHGGYTAVSAGGSGNTPPPAAALANGGGGSGGSSSGY